MKVFILYNLILVVEVYLLELYSAFIFSRKDEWNSILVCYQNLTALGKRYTYEMWKNFCQKFSYGVETSTIKNKAF